jgi:FkbM family methyltransferase
MLNRIRSLGKLSLRRWPKLFAAAKHCYGNLTYRLRIPHDPDFAFFRNFAGRTGLLVDVGANTGQSARSVRIFNRSLDVLSFEPNRLLATELQATRRLLGPGFDYRMVGLGRREQTITLYCPMAGDTPLTPWATADRTALERNRAHIEREVGTSIHVTSVPIEIRRFDDLGLHPVAVKIDVEGLELNVLQGMRETLERDEPILMIECSASTPEVAALLATFGYHTYEYNPRANTIRETSDPAATTNYFACTAAALERLVDSSSLKIIVPRTVGSNQKLAV